MKVKALDGSKRRVVITGYGMVTPLGRNTEETFDRCTRGMSGVDYITSFDTTGLPCRVGGQVKEEWLTDPQEGKEKRLEKFSSRGLTLMKLAAREAVSRADLHQVPHRERIGVSLGSYGDTPSVEEIALLHKFYDGNGHWDLEALMREGTYSAFQFFRRKPDMASAVLAKLFECRGANLSVASTCAAGAQAIGEAFKIIRSGKADVMLAGGCEAVLNFTGFIGFLLLKALAEKYTTPQKASRPFDRKRNGFVMSEGAAAVILEEFEHARARGATIAGELLGYGASADAYRITDTHPKGEGAAIAMQKALSDASLQPGDVDYINAHGTSTLRNDQAETIAIRQVFGERAKKIPVSSNKSMLGHSIAASGPIEFVLTLTGMNRSTILPTINYEFPDPKCDLWYVPNEALYRRHRIALSNSFGFGGQNACLCVGKVE